MSVGFGDFVFDPVQRELRRNGELLKVDAKLLQLLACFVAHPARLMSKRELLERVWEGRAVADNVLSVSVAKLRKVLGQQPGVNEYIENHYGRGYRFVCEVRAVEDAGPAHGSGSGSAHATFNQSPFVGRAGSLQRLEAALARAHAGRGSICMLVGEPGIGKTRLAEVLERLARTRGAATAWGRCQPSNGTPPLWPFAQVLREWLGPKGAELALGAALEDSDEPLESATSMLGRGALHDVIGTSHHTVDAISQSLIQASSDKTVVLFLDDLQWADAASLRVLSYLAGEISRWPILVVATARSTERTRDAQRERDFLRLLSHANCERIELERLQKADVDEYVAAAFGGSDAALTRALYDRSEGVPFFMVELLRPFLGGARPEPESLQVPGPALDLVRERLQALPAAAREVLSAAAVIGQSFDLGLLSNVTGKTLYELVEALDSSLANDTVVPSSDSTGAYAFDHTLIREVLYSDLPTLRRCQLHALAAEGLSLRRKAGEAVTSAELARHGLSALPCGDVSSAIAHARAAAVAATGFGAHEDARVWLQRALDALRFSTAPEPQLRSALLIELAIIERILSHDAYRTHLAQGVELAHQLRLGAMLTMAGQFLTPAPGWLAGGDAIALLEAAADVLPEEDHKHRAIVFSHMSWTPPNCASARKVGSLLEQAELLARESSDPEALATYLDAQLYFSAGPATRPAAERIAAQIQHAVRGQSTVTAGLRATSVLVFQLVTAMQRGERAEADRATQALSELHLRFKHTELAWHHERLLVVQRMNHGDWAGVPAELDRLRARAERLRLHGWRRTCLTDSAVYTFATGECSSMVSRLGATTFMLTTDSPNIRSIKIRTLVECGLMERARSALEGISIDSLRDLPQDRDYLSVLADLAFVASATKSLEHCAALYELIAPYPNYFAMGMTFHCYGSMSQHLGSLAVALGCDEQAREHLSQAVDANLALDLRGWALQSQFELARLLFESPRVRELNRARELLRLTAARAHELGMRPLHDAAERYLQGPAQHAHA